MASSSGGLDGQMKTPISVKVRLEIDYGKWPKSEGTKYDSFLKTIKKRPQVNEYLETFFGKGIQLTSVETSTDMTLLLFNVDEHAAPTLYSAVKSDKLKEVLQSYCQKMQVSHGTAINISTFLVEEKLDEKNEPRQTSNSKTIECGDDEFQMVPNQMHTDRKNTDLTVKKKTQTFVLYLHGIEANDVASITVLSLNKKINGINMALSGNVWVGRAYLPPDTQITSYWYQIIVPKYFGFNNKSILSKDMFNNKMFRHVQRDIYVYNSIANTYGFVKGIMAHLSNICFCTADKYDLNENVMQIENVIDRHFIVTMDTKEFESFIGRGKETYSYADTKLLWGVACGKIMNSYNITEHLISHDEADIILQGLRNYNLDSLPSSCERYLPSVCVTLCKCITNQRPYWPTWLRMSDPFLSETHLKPFLDANSLKLSDKNDQDFSDVGWVWQKMYNKVVTNESVDGKEASDAKDCLKVIMNACLYGNCSNIITDLCKSNPIEKLEKCLQDDMRKIVQRLTLTHIKKAIRQYKFSELANIWKTSCKLQLYNHKIVENIESEMIFMVKKVNESNIKENDVKMMIIDDKLFNNSDSDSLERQERLLNGLANSEIKCLHKLFLVASSLPKFASVLEKDKTIFDTCFKKLVGRHENKVPYVYDYISHILQLKAAEANLTAIINELHAIMEKYLLRIGIEHFIDSLKELISICEHRPKTAELINYQFQGLVKADKNRPMLIIIRLCHTDGSLKLDTQ